MGYHILNIEKNGKLLHSYVETYEEIALIDFISDDTVIYQGESHWKPFKISENEKYKNLSKGWFRAGILAQELFKKQATKNGYIIEELNQDQKSFSSYIKNSGPVSIKRGDYLIRNFANIEVDVKCRSFKTLNGKQYFDFKKEDVFKHKNMQKFTLTPIIIAVYKNENNKPNAENVYLISIDEIINNAEIKTTFRKEIGECFTIPISLTTKGLDFIKIIYNKHLELIQGKYSIENKMVEHPNAYSKWSKEDDEKLKKMLEKGIGINELSEYFMRNNGAIKSRIEKLGLVIF